MFKKKPNLLLSCLDFSRTSKLYENEDEIDEENNENIEPDWDYNNKKDISHCINPRKKLFISETKQGYNF
jgi:hypothetical protein